jgi:hypothetical protein
MKMKEFILLVGFVSCFMPSTMVFGDDDPVPVSDLPAEVSLVPSPGNPEEQAVAKVTSDFDRKLTDLNRQAKSAAGNELLDLQRRIEGLKLESEIAVYEARITVARETGNETRAIELEKALKELRTPRPADKSAQPIHRDPPPETKE